MSAPIIAIDGPSGSGKSSTSRGVADRLGLRYVDTGAMYRAMTLWMLDNGVDVDDPTAVARQCGEPVITMGVGIIGAILYAYTGMPSMVRTRFSSPTIGRSWIIGELGEATTDVDPEGTVRIKGAPWRAVTNRATPLKAGDRVRVVGLDRLLLEVEPEAGGAKDYRDRS